MLKIYTFEVSEASRNGKNPRHFCWSDHVAVLGENKLVLMVGGELINRAAIYSN